MPFKDINTFKYIFIHRHTHSFAGILAYILICVLAFPNRIHAQEATEFIEIPVSVTMKELGRVEISALIKDEILYLSVTDLFNFLKINNQLLQGLIPFRDLS